MRDYHRQWRICAVTVWAGILLAICGRVLLSPGHQDVYSIFAQAGRNWRSGGDLYEAVMAGDVFRYSPLVAALLVPFGETPEPWGGIFWRLLNAGCYLGALAWWIRAVSPEKGDSHLFQRAANNPVKKVPVPFFNSLVFLLIVPLSVGSLNNGQSNGLVLALLLGTTAAIAHHRWNVAALCMALACLFKVYPIALGLLLVSVFPKRFGWRLLAALGIGLALPFLFQRTGYVTSQYASWIDHLWLDDRQSRPLATSYRDLHLLFRVWLVPLSSRAYAALQLIVAAGIAGICVAGRIFHWPRRQLLTTTFGLACCWMTVFGPATESCTYIFLAPAFAWAVTESHLDHNPSWATSWLRRLLAFSFGLMIFAQASVWWGNLAWIRNIGLQPFAGLLFFVYLLASVARIFARRLTPSATTASFNPEPTATAAAPSPLAPG